MNTSIESLAWWRVHMAAANEAKRKGACWRCAAEMGCRATDAPGEQRGVELHAGCQEVVDFRGGGGVEWR
jgi:hypothetical protein